MYAFDVRDKGMEEEAGGEREEGADGPSYIERLVEAASRLKYVTPGLQAARKRPPPLTW